MNPTHIHLFLNHFVVIGSLCGFAMMAAVVIMKKQYLTKISLGMFVAIALLTIPVYLTGEPAGKVIRHLPDVTKSSIEEHEEASTLAMVAVEILGAVSIFGLYQFKKKERVPHWLTRSTFILSIIVAGLMIRTASMGGQLRHTEIRPEYQQPTIPADSSGAEEDD